MTTECKPTQESDVDSSQEQEATMRRLLPDTDIVEKPDGVILLVNMPGVAGSNVDLEVKGNQLSLTGTTGELAAHPTVYQRAFRLPDRIDRDTITARMEHGVLQVTLPVAAKPGAQKIAVTSNPA